jgi:hypothetical protein
LLKQKLKADVVVVVVARVVPVPVVNVAVLAAELPVDVVPEAVRDKSVVGSLESVVNTRPRPLYNWQSPDELIY